MFVYQLTFILTVWDLFVMQTIIFVVKTLISHPFLELKDIRPKLFQLLQRVPLINTLLYSLYKEVLKVNFTFARFGAKNESNSTQTEESHWFLEER